MQSFELTFYGTPPSMNTNAIRSHWTGFQRHKKSWQGQIEMQLLVAAAMRKVPRGCFDAAVVSGQLRFTSKRGRDEGNYRTLLEKACGDALVNAGWLPDDTPQHFQFNRLLLTDEKGRPPETLLVVEFYDRGEPCPIRS